MNNKHYSKGLILIPIIIIIILCSMFVSAVDLNDNLVSYYTFDAGLTDDHGSNDATNQGTTQVAGKLNNARQFDGSTDYIDLGTVNDFNIQTSDFTLQLWVKFDTLGNLEYILSNRDGNGMTIFMTKNSANELQFKIQNLGGATLIDTGEFYTVTNNVWYLMTFVYDRGTGIKAYINGAEEGSDLDSTTATIADKSFYAGRRPDDVATFDGTMDELMIYNRVLSPTEILEVYNSGSGIYYDSNPTTPTGSSIANISGTITVTGTGGTSGNDIKDDGTTLTYNYEFRCDSAVGTIKQAKSSDNTWEFDDSCVTNTVYVNIWTVEGSSESTTYETESILINSLPSLDGYIILPVENNISTTSWIYYQYNYSDPDLDTIIYNLTIFLDGIYNNSYNTSEGNITINVDGNYSLIMNASDELSNTTAPTSWVLRDTVNPLILNASVTPKNSTVIYNVTNTLLNATFSDDNLYGYNVTCYNQDDSVAYTTQQTGLSVQSYDFTDYHRFNGIPGQKTCEFTVADSHTAQQIDFNTKIKRSFLGFGEDKLEINGGEVEIIYPKENKNKIIDVGYQKQKDRISPIFKTEKDYDNEYTELEYVVRYNGKVDHINSKYLGHIVVLPDNNLKQGYWHDLENELGADIVSTEEVIYSDKKEIKYKLRIPNTNYHGELKTNSIGGLNIVSENVTFTTQAGQNITINSTEDWTGNSANVNITWQNSSNTQSYSNINLQYFEVPCNSSTLSISSSNYINSYDYSGNCNFESQYDLTFWQGTIEADVKNEIKDTLITSPTLKVTDGSVTKYYTPSSGEQTVKVNIGTYTLNSSKTGYLNSDDVIEVVSYNEIEPSIVYMDKDITLKITVLDAETGTWNTSLDATVDVYNEDATFNYSETFSGGVSSVFQVKESINRLNIFADGYNANTLYYDLTDSQQYNITVLLTNATATGVTDLVIQVRDDANQLLENAEVRVYKQDGSSFTLVTSPRTNINGETLIQTILETVFYKFTVYYNDQKCYESSNPFTIQSNDDILYLKCVLEGDYISARDAYNEVTTDLSHFNGTNLLGYFTYEGQSTYETQFCLYVYDDTNNNELVNSSCENSTNSLIVVNVDATSKTKDNTYRAVATYIPNGFTQIKVAGIDYINFIIDSRTSLGVWGIFLVLIAIICVVLAMFDKLTMIPLGIGVVYFIATWFKIIEIPLFPPYGSLASGILGLIICVMVTISISTNKGE